MKKTMLAVAVAVAVGLAAYQPAEARYGAGQGAGGACCSMMGMGSPGPGGKPLSKEELKAREKFFSETTELRKKMFSKKTELEAVMGGGNPDEKKAARLSEELFDLRDQMQKKAQESGLAKAGFGCGGPGGMGGQDMGEASGRHRARR